MPVPACTACLFAEGRNGSLQASAWAPAEAHLPRAVAVNTVSKRAEDKLRIGQVIDIFYETPFLLDNVCYSQLTKVFYFPRTIWVAVQPDVDVQKEAPLVQRSCTPGPF